MKQEKKQSIPENEPGDSGDWGDWGRLWGSPNLNNGTILKEEINKTFLKMNRDAGDSLKELPQNSRQGREM